MASALFSVVARDSLSIETAFADSVALGKFYPSQVKCARSKETPVCI